MSNLQSHLSTGDRLRLAMKRSRLTAPDLATQLGVEGTRITAWLTGQEVPPASALKAWSKATGASLAWLSDAPSEPAGSEPTGRRYVRGSRAKYSGDKPEA